MPHRPWYARLGSRVNGVQSSRAAVGVKDLAKGFAAQHIAVPLVCKRARSFRDLFSSGALRYSGS